jgi:hypothetical protein
MAVMGTVEDQVVAAALARADALASGDGEQLRSLLHPDFRWTSHLGEQLDRELYVASNTGQSLTWNNQSLAGIAVQVEDRWLCLAGHAGPRLTDD